jgi:hypothetical protein
VPLNTPFTAAEVPTVPSRSIFGGSQFKIPAVDADGPSIGKGRGNGTAGLTQYSGKGGPRDAHHRRGFGMFKSFGIRQAKGFESLHREVDPHKVMKRDPIGFVKIVPGKLTDPTAFARTRHQGLLYFEHMFKITPCLPVSMVIMNICQK